jgi:hypothetical protein
VVAVGSGVAVGGTGVSVGSGVLVAIASRVGVAVGARVGLVVAVAVASVGRLMPGTMLLLLGLAEDEDTLATGVASPQAARTRIKIKENKSRRCNFFTGTPKERVIIRRADKLLFI